MAEDSGLSGLTSGTVKLPGIGPVKKVYVYVGIGAVGIGAAYWMWSRQKAAEDVTPTDADLGDGLTTDPGSDVYTNPNATGTTWDDTILAAPKTNAEWTTRALDYFNWLEPSFVSSTIGKYLARVSLSSEEADLVRQIWAVQGKPPEGPATFTLTTTGNTPGSTTDLAPPAGVLIGPIGSTWITVKWTNAVGATGYDIYRDGSKIGEAHSSEYTATGLKPGTAYTFYVKSKTSGKQSSESATVKGTTTNPKAPGSGAPTGTSGKVGAISGRVTTATKTTITASFKAASNAVKYDIILDGKPYKTVTETKFTIAGLNANSHHTVGIQPVGANGAKGSISNTTLYTKK